MKPKNPVNPAIIKKFEAIEASNQLLAQTNTTISYDELEATIKSYLLITDRGLIKIIVAVIICHRLPLEPVWLLIVAGPGGGKTELLSGLYDLANVYPLSDLTPQTFMSGYKDPKGSLLERLPSEVILIMKDFTTVLEFPPEKQAAILAQFREIYDGSYGKEFGNAESRQWRGKMGFLAGVTPAIDRKQPIHQALGERFIKYRPTPADSMEVTKRAMGNSGNEKQMREDIRNAFTNYLENLDIPQTAPEVPQDYKDAVMHLAVFCAKARSVVLRDSRGNREIVDVPEPEHPTRLVKQLVNLLSALAVVNGDFTKDDYRIIYKIGMDSLTAVRRLVIEHLFVNDSPQSLGAIAEAIGYPQNTARRQLEELQALKLVTGDHASMAYSYELTADSRELMTKARLTSETEDQEGVSYE
jgi:hypothetical protein